MKLMNGRKKYSLKQAAKFIIKGDIAVIKTGDDHPYYLLKLTSSPYETVSEITDDYRHTFPPYHRVVEGNYLEVFKECSDGSLYYVDVKQKAIVSGFCVVGNCPTLPTVTKKKYGKKLRDAPCWLWHASSSLWAC